MTILLLAPTSLCNELVVCCLSVSVVVNKRLLLLEREMEIIIIIIITDIFIPIMTLFYLLCRCKYGIGNCY